MASLVLLQVFVDISTLSNLEKLEVEFFFDSSTFSTGFLEVASDLC